MDTPSRPKEPIVKRSAFAILLATLAAVLCWGLSPCIARADSDESRGYWEFYKSTITEDGFEPYVVAGAFDGVGYNRGAYTRWECTHGKYTEQFVVNEDIYHTESSDLALAAGDEVTSVATYDVPKKRYRDTDKLTMNYDLSCGVVKRDVMLDLFQKLVFRPWVEYGVIHTDDGGKEQFSEKNGITYLDNEDGDSTARTDKEHPNAKGTFTCKLRSSYNDYESAMRIVVDVMHMRAEYWYRWVDEPVATEGGTEETPPAEKDQNEQKDIVIPVDAPNVAGEIFKFTIPVVIVTGAAVAAVKLRGRKKGGSDDDSGDGPGDDPEPPEPPKCYRMVASKDFGNKLRPGAAARTVWAHIEERSRGTAGAFRPNREMTEAIRAVGAQGLEARYDGTRGADKVVRVSVPKEFSASTAQPILDLSYTGKGGTFTTRIKFQLVGDPAIFFIGPDGARLPMTAVLDLLIGDEDEGSPLIIGVENFTEKVEADDVKILADDGISTSLEPYSDSRYPDAHLFKAMVRNDIPLETPYGRWPLKKVLVIGVSKGDEECAVTMPLCLWPEGMYIDMSDVPDGLLDGSRVVVDTAAVCGDSRNAETGGVVSLGVGVARKDAKGYVEFDLPNEAAAVVDHPEDPHPFLRLTGQGAGRGLFGAEDPRVCYDLRFEDDTPAGEQRKMAKLVLAPLFPIVTRSEGDSLPAYFELSYEGDDMPTRLRASFAFTGIVEEVKDRGVEFEPTAFDQTAVIDRIEGMPEVDKYVLTHEKYLRPQVPEVMPEVEEYLLTNTPEVKVSNPSTTAVSKEDEIKRIMRILQVMDAHEMEGVKRVFERYGEPATAVARGVGSSDELKKAAQSHKTLVKQLYAIDSPHTLWLIRHEIYDAAYRQLTLDASIYRAYAYWWDGCYLVMSGVRWLNDLYFTAWWYGLLGTDAWYVEPLMTPLKDWLLGWFEEVGACLHDDEADISANYFTWEKFKDKAFPTLVEGELAGMVTYEVFHKGPSRSTFIMLGVFVCFLFYKNVQECMAKSKNGSLDLWKALKGTMADCTTDAIKIMMSVYCAKKFAGLKNEGEANPPGVSDMAQDGIIERLCAPMGSISGGTMEGWKLWTLKTTERSGLTWNRKMDIAQGIFDATFSKSIDSGRNVASSRTDPAVSSYGASSLNELSLSLSDTAARAIDPKRSDVSSTNEPAASSFDEWALSLGDIPVRLTGPDGKGEEVVRVPAMTYATLWVDWAFKELGIDIDVDFAAVLPKDCPYTPRDELAEKLREAGAGFEAAALEHPREINEFPLPPNISIAGSTSLPMQR